MRCLPEAMLSAGTCAADDPAAASPPQSESHWHWQMIAECKGRDMQLQHPGNAQACLYSTGKQHGYDQSKINDALAARQQVCALHEAA